MNYPIPKDSAEAYRQHKNRVGQNPGLIFDRFVPNWGDSRSKDAKRDAWLEVESVCNKGDHEILTAWNTRWEETVKVYHAVPSLLSTDWRMVTGLGNKGPLEAGFTFHRCGFAMLPGSSLKGIARTWGLLEVAEKLETDELNELDTALSLGENKDFDKAIAKFSLSGEAADWIDEFRTIFGTTDQAGRAIFFDAIPAHLPKLELDVMTPHYAPYYQDDKGRTPPSNWHSPQPILFLTVAPGVPFRFAVGWRGELSIDLRDKAAVWLENGLTELGAGAKTSAGYGYFIQPDQDLPESLQQQNDTGDEAYAIKRQRLLKESPHQGRFRGTVAEVRQNGSYGFINPARGGKQWFVHNSQIRDNIPLREGQVVEFEIGQYQGKDQAQDVVILLQPD